MSTTARWSAPIAIAMTLSLAVLVAGCADPTAGVTAAKVGEAQPVPDASLPEAEAAAEPTPEADTAAEAATEPAPAKGEAYAEAAAAVTEAPAAGEAVAFDGSNSKIGFVGSKLVGGGHDGGFKTFTGRFVLAPEGDAVASVATAIDMHSLWSDNDNLTGHLKNQDFFEVDTYPSSKFVSTAIAPAPAGAEGGATHEVTGNLTLHGVEKSVTFPAKVAVTGDAVTLEAEFKIDRTIWGIVYGAESDVRDRIINKDVVIRLDVDAPRGADAAPADAAE